MRKRRNTAYVEKLFLGRPYEKMREWNHASGMLLRIFREIKNGSLCIPFSSEDGVEIIKMLSLDISGLRKAGIDVRCSRYPAIKGISVIEDNLFSAVYGLETYEGTYVAKLSRVLHGCMSEYPVLAYLHSLNLDISLAPLCDLKINSYDFGLVASYIKGKELGKWLQRELSNIGFRNAEAIISSVGGITRELHDAMLRCMKDVCRPVRIMNTETERLIEEFNAKISLLPEEIKLPRRKILEILSSVPDLSKNDLLIRTHGDLHLNQFIRDSNTSKLTLMDFRGEPYSWLWRRNTFNISSCGYPPYKDIASLITSINYLLELSPINPDMKPSLFERFVMSLLKGYVSRCKGTENIHPLNFEKLFPWIVDRALYEIIYEYYIESSYLPIPLKFLKDLLNKGVLYRILKNAFDTVNRTLP